MDRKHTVSLCMIVKNEESCLRRCLESLNGVVDEIIIVDTGSTDRTIEIAREFNSIIQIYNWNNDFASARNYSLSFATKDWILVLDADEYLRQEDLNKLIDALNDFNYDSYFIKTLNFTTSITDENYMVNLNQRIFKNHKGFKYIGSIHEQLQFCGDEKTRLSNRIIEVGFYHTGYLRETVELKNKPQRNMEILTLLLEKEPDNAFHKFNLANEMFQLKKYDEASKLYDEAYYSSNASQGFMPKLMVFRINNLITNGNYEKAFEAIQEGISMYPSYTHLWFLKATLEEHFGLVTKSINSYEMCIKLGKPQPELEFSEKSYGLWPHIKLANLFEFYHDYQKAVEHYNAFLTLDNRQYQILYHIASCLKKMGLSGKEMVIQLEKYLKPDSINNQILLSDLLLKQSFFIETSRYLKRPTSQTNSQLVYLYGKQQFYLSNFEESKQAFNQYLTYDKIDIVAPYFYLMYLITKDTTLSINQISYPDSILHLDQCLRSQQISQLENSDIRMLMVLVEECLISNQDELLTKLSNIESLNFNRCLTISLVSLYLRYNFKKEAQVLLLKLLEEDREIKKDTVLLVKSLLVDKCTI